MTITIKPNKKFTQHHSLSKPFLGLVTQQECFRQQHQAMAVMEIGTLGGFK